MMQITRKANQGPCICDDCGKQMLWKGIEWCILSAQYLLCSPCVRRWFKEGIYHLEPDEARESSLLVAM
jgi:hypothetical protein